MNSISSSDSITPSKWAEIVERSAQQPFGSLVDTSNETIKVSLVDIGSIKTKDIESYKDIEKISELSLETFQQLQGPEKAAYARNLRLLSQNISQYAQGVSYNISKQLNVLKYAIEDEIPEELAEEPPEEASPQSRLVALLNTIQPTTTKDEIKAAVDDNLNSVFDSHEDIGSFINALINNYQNDASFNQPLLSLFSELINHHAELTAENKAALVQHLFRSTVPSIFALLMQTEENNILFDILMKQILEEDFLNANPDIRTQIYVFGFSAERYNALWVTPDRVKAEDYAQTMQLSQQFRSPEFRHAYSTQRENPILMQQWLASRMSVSSTLTSNETGVAGFREQWIQAERKMYELAVNHRDTHAHLSLETICGLHKELMSGEIENAGKLRSGDEIVRCSDGTYVPPSLLPYRLEDFMTWFNAQCDACDRGEADPIFFAFEAKQRFASLHPFPNGNGRISALLMDYILQRNSIPPPIIDRQQFSTAVFPLNPTPPNVEHAYTAFAAGILRSLNALQIRTR